MNAAQCSVVASVASPVPCLSCVYLRRLSLARLPIAAWADGATRLHARTLPPRRSGARDGCAPYVYASSYQSYHRREGLEFRRDTAG